MPLGDEYLGAIRGFEGFHRRPYWDYRQWTSGYGTRASGPGEEIDQGEADRRFRTELGSARDRVRGLGVTLSPGQEAALTSLTYNAGPGWMNSGLGAAVRAGDWRSARQRFLQYVNAGGRPLPGLVRRRGVEAAWLDGPPGTGGAPLGGPPPVAPPGTPPAPEPPGGLQAIMAGLGNIMGPLSPIASASAQTPPGGLTLYAPPTSPVPGTRLMPLSLIHI